MKEQRYIETLGNIGIVLDRTRHAANIGAVCRLIKNLGIRRLHLVTPTEYGHLAAIRMMRGSEDILEAAPVHENIDEAACEYHLTYATSHRMRQDEALDIRQAAREIANKARENRVALIFGSEKYGLANDDVKKADRVVKLPSEPDFPSINVAQAVAMLALEVKLEVMALPERAAEGAEPVHLPKGERELFYKSFLSLFHEIGFDNPSVLEKVRGVFDRANLRPEEKNLLMGLVKEIKRKTGWK